MYSYTLKTKMILHRTSTTAGRLQYCAGDTEQYLWLLLVLVKEYDKGNKYYSPVSTF